MREEIRPQGNFQDIARYQAHKGVVTKQNIDLFNSTVNITNWSVHFTPYSMPIYGVRNSTAQVDYITHYHPLIK